MIRLLNIIELTTTGGHKARPYALMNWTFGGEQEPCYAIC